MHQRLHNTWKRKKLAKHFILAGHFCLKNFIISAKCFQVSYRWSPKLTNLQESSHFSSNFEEISDLCAFLHVPKCDVNFRKFPVFHPKCYGPSLDFRKKISGVQEMSQGGVFQVPGSQISHIFRQNHGFRFFSSISCKFPRADRVSCPRHTGKYLHGQCMTLKECEQVRFI